MCYVNVTFLTCLFTWINKDNINVSVVFSFLGMVVSQNVNINIRTYNLQTRIKYRFHFIII